MIPEVLKNLDKGEILVSPMDGGGKFAFFAQSPNHTIMADEPLDNGGTDSGLSPHDLLAASLGTCTSITLRFYAEGKGIPLGEFYVKVSQKSAVDADTGELTYVLTRHLYFPEETDQERLNKYKEIAEKCPIHRKLQGKIKIDTEVMKTEV